MRIAEIIKAEAIDMNLDSSTKEKAIRSLVSTVAQANGLEQGREILDQVMKREEDCSTGIGHGIAFPHAQVASLAKTYLAFGRASEGVAYESPDGEPVKFVFLLIGPLKDTRHHLLLLATLSRLMHREENRKSILQAQSADEILAILNRA